MKFYFLFFSLLFSGVSFQAGGSSGYVDVKLRDLKNIHSGTTQEPFFVISNSQKGVGFGRAYGSHSPRIIELNRLMVPASLYGRRCSISYAKTPKSFPPIKIHEVLPAGTVLTVVSFFTTVKDVSWFRRQVFKIIHNIGLAKHFPGRGGPMTYYIARDPKGDEVALSSSVFPYPNWPRVRGLGEEETIKVLAEFKNNSQKYQRVLLIFETHDEYWTKCNYAGIRKEDTSHDPLIALNEMKRMEDIHDFQNVTWDGQRMEVTVDYLALAYLIYRSHKLRIKDIIFLADSTSK